MHLYLEALSSLLQCSLKSISDLHQVIMGSIWEDYDEPVRPRGRSENSAYSKTATHEDKSHQVISSYFIGPQAEKLGYFTENMHAILDELEKARHAYFPEDGVCTYRTRSTMILRGITLNHVI